LGRGTGDVEHDVGAAGERREEPDTPGVPLPEAGAGEGALVLVPGDMREELGRVVERVRRLALRHRREAGLAREGEVDGEAVSERGEAGQAHQPVRLVRVAA